MYRVMFLLLSAFILSLPHESNAAASGGGPNPPRPCPLAECGAPSFRPEIYSIVPTAEDTFAQVVSYFNRDLTRIPDSVFIVKEYTSLADLPALLEPIVASSRTGGIAVYMTQSKIADDVDLVLQEEKNFPTAVILKDDKNFRFDMLNGLPNVRPGARSPDPEYIGADARNAFVEWWGVWKAANLPCCSSLR